VKGEYHLFSPFRPLAFLNATPSPF